MGAFIEIRCPASSNFLCLGGRSHLLPGTLFLESASNLSVPETLCLINSRAPWEFRTPSNFPLENEKFSVYIFCRLVLLEQDKLKCSQDLTGLSKIMNNWRPVFQTISLLVNHHLNLPFVNMVNGFYFISRNVERRKIRWTIIFFVCKTARHSRRQLVFVFLFN